MVLNRFVFLYCIVDKNECLFINIVYDKVKVAVIVKIRIYGTVRHGRFINSRRFGSVRKSLIVVVQIQIIRKINMIKFGQSFPDHLFLFCPAFIAVEYLTAELQEIAIDEIAPDAICNMHVLPSVIIKIRHQHTPAPVCRLDAGQLPDLAEKRNHVSPLRTEPLFICSMLRMNSGS